MSAKLPANWREVKNHASDEVLWWRRFCGQYECRRVGSLDGLQTQALYTPDDGVPVPLGVYSSLPMAMAACVDHIEGQAVVL